MLDTLLNLIGITLDDFNVSDDVVFTVCAIIVLYCVGYMFNFFQTLMERISSKKR